MCNENVNYDIYRITFCHDNKIPNLTLPSKEVKALVSSLALGVWSEREAHHSGRGPGALCSPLWVPGQRLGGWGRGSDLGVEPFGKFPSIRAFWKNSED